MVAANDQPEDQAREPSTTIHRPAPSPISPGALAALFFRPRAFFTSGLDIGGTPYVLIMAWSMGIVAAMNRIDQNMIQVDLGEPRPGWEELVRFIADWPGYWLVVIALGAIGGTILWWVGGWWYKIRIRWSGATDPDPRLARILYVYSDFVMNGPMILWAVVATFVYAGFLESWESEELYSTVLLIFPFWSLYANYGGVTASFEVSKGRTLWWFVILPGAFYFLAFGLVFVLYGLYYSSQ